MVAETGRKTGGRLVAKIGHPCLLQTVQLPIYRAAFSCQWDFRKILTLESNIIESIVPGTFVCRRVSSPQRDATQAR